MNGDRVTIPATDVRVGDLLTRVFPYVGGAGFLTRTRELAPAETVSGVSRFSSRDNRREYVRIETATGYSTVHNVPVAAEVAVVRDRRCTCGALDLDGCFCGLTIPEFLGTPTTGPVGRRVR